MAFFENDIFMDLLELKFIAFVIITAITYFLIPRKYRWIVLLISSLCFYYYAGKTAMLTMIAISLFTYVMGIMIEKSSAASKKQRLIVISSVIVLVGWLFLTKLSGLNNWNYRFLVIPLGVSYISFSHISYLVDIYWDKDKADRNFMRYLLYSLFFPKITQGPIAKHKELSIKLYDGGILSYHNVCYGVQRMIYGYFKKLVIADRAAVFTTQVFADVNNYSGSVITVATVLAALQLYCDFSGYMDIILGFAQVLGLEMEENFKRPFFSKSVAEFWRRWHITLGVWFKDYVYNPVAMSHTIKYLGKWGRKRIGKRFGNSIIKIIALGAVWVLTGIWHGTGINYIIWGIYWGSIIIISAIFENEIKRFVDILHINTDASSWKLFQMIRTFLLFCFGIMIIRVSNLHEIKIIGYNVLKSFNLWNIFDGTLYNIGLNKNNFNIMTISLIFVLIISLLQERGSVRESIAKLNTPVRWIFYALSISVVLFLGIYGTDYISAGFAYTHF